MAVIRNNDNEYIDTAAQALRTTSVDASGNPTSLAPVARTKSTTRVTTATTTNITAGAQSYTVTVITASGAASPTLDGVALPAGYTATFSVVYGRDTLPSAAVVTATGDDVIILQVR